MSGVNFIDTAAVYGAGHSEEVVGRALKGRRQKWIVETKGGESFDQDGINRRDFSRSGLLAAIEGSLKRLDTDYIDVYLLHSPSDAVLAQGECFEALSEIKRSGKARRGRFDLLGADPLLSGDGNHGRPSGPRQYS